MLPGQALSCAPDLAAARNGTTYGGFGRGGDTVIDSHCAISAHRGSHRAASLQGHLPLPRYRLRAAIR